MYKIIGGDGQEYGPVSADQLRQWIAEGRVNAQTMVLPEGSVDWVPLAAVPELTTSLPGTSAAPVPADTRDYLVTTGAWINGGWRLLTSNAGQLIGATLLVGAIMAGVSFVSQAGQLLMRGAGRGRPALLVMGLALMGVSWVGSMVLSGPLYGGLYWLFLRRLRGVAAEIGEVFTGFRRGFLQLILASIVPGLLAMLCVVPGMSVLVIGAGVHLGGGKASPVAIGLLALGGILALLGLCAAVYLSVGWMFSLPLVIDKQLGFWEAMSLSRKLVTRHWWGMFGTSFVFGLITLSGVLACCVGLIFTIPLFFAMLVCAYEDIFGQRPATTA